MTAGTLKHHFSATCLYTISLLEHSLNRRLSGVIVNAYLIKKNYL